MSNVASVAPLTAVASPAENERDLSEMLPMLGLLSANSTQKIDPHGRDVISRLFYYQRDMQNMLRFGKDAPKSAELIYIDPAKVTLAISHKTSYRVDSGLVRGGDWDLETVQVAMAKKIKGVKQRITRNLPWEKTSAWAKNVSYISRGTGVDGIRTEADIVARYQALDRFILEVTRDREAAFRTRAELSAGNFREAAGVLVHIGRNGELLFGMRGCHRLAVAQALGLSFMPAQLGVVHESAVVSGTWRKNILEQGQVADLRMNRPAAAAEVSTAPKPVKLARPAVVSSAPSALDDDKSRLYYPERYGEHTTSGSIEYGKNRDQHWNALPVETYQRLLPHIPGKSVVEIGAAEGIMSLTMALQKEKVRSIEITPFRHQRAVKLRDRWLELGKPVSNCEMVQSDIFANPDLLKGYDTFFASRVIYYFGERIPELMEHIAKRNEYIVLVGNEKRQKLYRRGHFKEVGEYAKYTSVEGMHELVTDHGYKVINAIETGDPVIIGQRVSFKAKKFHEE